MEPHALGNIMRKVFLESPTPIVMLPELYNDVPLQGIEDKKRE